jgi:hypothetical protein
MQGKHKVIRQKFIIDWFDGANDLAKDGNDFELLPDIEKKKQLDKIYEYDTGELQEVPFEIPEDQEEQPKKISDVETSPYNYLQHSYITP